MLQRRCSNLPAARSFLPPELRAVGGMGRSPRVPFLSDCGSLSVGNIMSLSAYASRFWPQEDVMKIIRTILTYIEASADAYVESKLSRMATRVEKRL